MAIKHAPPQATQTGGEDVRQLLRVRMYAAMSRRTGVDPRAAWLRDGTDGTAAGGPVAHAAVVCDDDGTGAAAQARQAANVRLLGLLGG